MTALDSLSTFELTGEQLESVNGGILPVLLVINGVLKLTFVYLAVTG